MGSSPTRETFGSVVYWLGPGSYISKKWVRFPPLLFLKYSIFIASMARMSNPILSGRTMPTSQFVFNVDKNRGIMYHKLKKCVKRAIRGLKIDLAFLGHF